MLQFKPDNFTFFYNAKHKELWLANGETYLRLEDIDENTTIPIKTTISFNIQNKVISFPVMINEVSLEKDIGRYCIRYTSEQPVVTEDVFEIVEAEEEFKEALQSLVYDISTRRDFARAYVSTYETTMQNDERLSKILKNTHCKIRLFDNIYTGNVTCGAKWEDGVYKLTIELPVIWTKANV